MTDGTFSIALYKLWVVAMIFSAGVNLPSAHNFTNSFRKGATLETLRNGMFGGQQTDYDVILIVCRELCARTGESLFPRRS